MHGKISSISHVSHPLFTDIPSPYEVCRYHSLAIAVAPECELEVIAESHSKEVMAIAHHTLPLWGVQFHPEYKSTVENPHPLFVGFVKAALEKSSAS